jgi:hypothetical protein
MKLGEIQVVRICSLILAMLFFAGCTSPADRDFQKFQKNAKQTIDPLKLQEWAVSVAAQHDNGYEMQKQDVPFWIRKAELEEFTPTVFVSLRSKEEGKTVYVTWGGGFGHWGLTVGDKNFIIHDDKSNRAHYVPWIPGVYFFKDW